MSCYFMGNIDALEAPDLRGHASMSYLMCPHALVWSMCKQDA